LAGGPDCQTPGPAFGVAAGRSGGRWGGLGEDNLGIPLGRQTRKTRGLSPAADFGAGTARTRKCGDHLGKNPGPSRNRDPDQWPGPAGAGGQGGRGDSRSGRGKAAQPRGGPGNDPRVDCGRSRKWQGLTRGECLRKGIARWRGAFAAEKRCTQWKRSFSMSVAAVAKGDPAGCDRPMIPPYCVGRNWGRRELWAKWTFFRNKIMKKRKNPRGPGQ